MTDLKINSMINKIRPTFTMVVGIPGSGKSTFAEEHKNENTIHISSDAIREEIFGDAGCQDDNSRVFTMMHERTLEALKNGYNVIYDATNITRKSRASILKQIPTYVRKECMIVWAPVEYCISRDLRRGRHVGEDVIMSMLKRFEAPFYDEGFDDIDIYFSGICPHPIEYHNKCVKALKIPHDNPHHTADIAEHCKLCGDNLSNLDLPPVVIAAGYLHDIGKPITKTFVNTKGETTDIAHYYGHQGAGAWISYGLSDITLAWLISTHMAPFLNQKYYTNLDPLYKNWIDALHECDKMSK